MPKPPRRDPWRHPALSLLLPAALIALGAWQLTRIVGDEEGFAARAARMDASIARLRPLAERDPGTTIRFTSGRTATASEAMRLMQEDRDSLGWDVRIEQARTAAAWTAAGAGTLALVAALLGLLATAVGARRGLASRTRLVGAFRGVMRMLPPLLGCVTAATAVGVTAAVLFEAGGAWFWTRISTGEVKLLLIGLIMVVGVLWYAAASVWRLRRALDAFTPQPMDVLGRVVGPADAPGLWALVADVAARQGAKAPDHIVAGLTGGFFVTSSRVEVAPEGRVLSGNTLYVSASYLPLLSREEVTAIIAHELAHFTGEDTQYSLHFLPLFAGMSRSMAAVSGVARQGRWDRLLQPASILAGHVLDTFDRVVNHWSRLRELGADNASLRVGEARHAAAALVRTGMGGGLIGATVNEVFEHPARAGNDVVGAVLARAGAVGFTSPQRHLEDRQPHPTDTHPPARQRIEAMGVPIDDTLLAQASRPVQPEDEAYAGSLFQDWRGLREELGADLLAIALARDARRHTALQQAATAITEEVALHENVRAIFIMLIVVAAVMFALAAGVAWLTLTDWAGTDDQSPMLIIGGTCGAAGVAILVLAFMRRRRGRAGPFLVVGPDGFRCIGITGMVPWSQIRGVQVMTGQQFITTFHLDPAAPLPVRTGHRWAVKVNAKKRVLTLNGMAPRGMKPQAYLDLLNQALRAYRAREALRAREAEEARTAPG